MGKRAKISLEDAMAVDEKPGPVSCETIVKELENCLPLVEAQMNTKMGTMARPIECVELKIPRSDAATNVYTRSDRIPEHAKLDAKKVQLHGLLNFISNLGTQVLTWLVLGLLPMLRRCGGSIPHDEMAAISLALQAWALDMIFEQNKALIKHVMHITTAQDFTMTMLPYLPDFFPQYPGRSELESKIQKAVNPKPMYVQGFNPLFKALNSNAIGTKMSRRDMAQHFGKFAEGHLFHFLRDAQRVTHYQRKER